MYNNQTIIMNVVLVTLIYTLPAWDIRLEHNLVDCDCAVHGEVSGARNLQQIIVASVQQPGAS